MLVVGVSQAQELPLTKQNFHGLVNFLCRKKTTVAATFMLPGYQHDHIIHGLSVVQPWVSQWG